MPVGTFEVFKEIVIGGLDKVELLQRLTEAGVQFNQYAETLFSHPQFAPRPGTEKVKLVKTTLSALGLKDTCTFEEFTSRIAEAELKLCPLSLAAFLRLEYLDQPEGPYLTVATNKPDPNEAYPNGFYLRKNGGTLWLRGYRADGFAGWPDGNEFVFMKICPTDSPEKMI